ncbi:transketolase family protein [Lachnotalea sp. AF33-28]|uniref:transketolase family protein n=1 Tax=Lachnotalea sp. AF33-28 TaxID=2292046 RepID=UPI000E50634F|nr:transketolase C-terminal domain-containing protein [Lachnotalea sp. AF33-28]RHP29097.1 transketolase family protein [Lachnotalea sp. AF33-28]
MNIHNQRSEYGKALVELGEENPDIVVLEADLGRSTMSCMFEERFPGRYFEMGIAEQNMTSFAGGLALTGKIAFTNTFAVFAAGRAYDQIRQSIATAELNVKIAGSSSGLSDFGDGATHQAVDDVALMSAVPNMTVFTPCDGPEVRMAVRAAAAVEGPCYIRLSRNDVADVFPAGAQYRIGEPVVLREGEDVAVFTHGILAQEALKAALEAGREGISVSVIHVPTVKPLNENAVKALVSGKKGVVVCEECSIRGGLGMLVSYILRGSALPVECVAVMDVFGQSAGSHEELLACYGLDSAGILKKIMKIMQEA